MPEATDVRKLARACITRISKTLIAERRERILPEFRLDSFQQRVVDSQARFMRVVAPAGSGKTRTLIAKAINVLDANDNSRVLCLTFTNAAANEFRERASKLHTSLANRLQVSTLNAFGYDTLKVTNESLKVVSPSNKIIGVAYGVIKKLMPESSIWGGETQPQFYAPILELADMTKSLGFDHLADRSEAQEQYSFVEALDMVPLLQNLMAEIGIEDSPKTAFTSTWFPFWKKLTEKLWKSNLITLDDQKYWALNRLANHGGTQQWLCGKRFSHILVDEFQDINILDLFLISQIALVTEASLIIVGDDDQCIYEWRGCTSLFIQRPDLFFESVLGDQEFETVLLKRNYRCPHNIVIHSKHLINTNQDRIEKDTVPMREDDADIRIIPLPAAYMTMNVVDELAAFLADKHPQHTVAIVGRKKCQLIPIQILLTRRGTKFAIDTDLNVFGGKAFQDFRKFMEFPKIYTQARQTSKNVEDLLALLNRIKKTPVSKQENQEIHKWLSEKKPKTLQEAVIKFSEYPGKFKRGFVQPKEVTSDLIFFLESTSVVASLYRAGDVFKGFQKDFVKSKEDIFYSDPPFSHLADLAVNYDNDFDAFLSDIDRAIERAAGADPRGAKIELMTALRTKGREFDTVIVLDVNDGIWPNKKSQEEGRLEEERRLFYVTVTRTKNNLLLFESGRVQGQRMAASPFIQEMALPTSAWLSDPQLERLSHELLAQLKI
ncbi:MAG: ATP-dependent helicase [Myxacorys californica WJT36-NPBG1]|jgi:DNA helicase-2/ATP-dependent DNA helicase PcrA|nr:ATP-dependent helicase [Myxacorys californica WJT36-NPBG1]